MIIVQIEPNQLDNLIQNACKKALSEIEASPVKTESDELLTVQDTAKFLHLSVPTIYGLIHKNQLPVMKRSKRCYFSKADLINYLKEGRRKTAEEMAKETDAFLGKSKKRGLK